MVHWCIWHPFNRALFRSGDSVRSAYEAVKDRNVSVDSAHPKCAQFFVRNSRITSSIRDLRLLCAPRCVEQALINSRVRSGDSVAIDAHNRPFHARDL